jgi:hypothetical protein
MRVFKAWNIINNLIGGYTFGHVLWESKLLVAELSHRGTETRILGHRSINAEDFPGARVIPAFQLHHREPVSSDRDWGYLENFVVHNMAFEKTLGRLDRGLFSTALTMFLDMSERQMLGAVRWLKRFDDASRPHVAMMLKGQIDWSAGNTALEMYGKIWAGCSGTFKQRVKLCVRSDVSAANYEPVFRTRPHVLPSILSPTKREIRAAKERNGAQTGPLTVSFLAGARPERGAGFIPDVVKQCAHLGIHFLVQLTDPYGADSVLVDSVRALRDRPDVRFHDGVLPRDQYNDWIAQSVVLLPYDAALYQSRLSGVYDEAKSLGAPVIVPAGTWMAEDVSRIGNGLVFEDYTAASIAGCIARAKNDLGGLRTRAAALAASYSREHGADRCVDAVEALFDNR